MSCRNINSMNDNWKPCYMGHCGRVLILSQVETKYLSAGMFVETIKSFEEVGSRLVGKLAPKSVRRGGISFC